MTDNREEAIRFLADKARANSGVQTEAEKARQEAVGFLTGKQQQREPLRPGVEGLLPNRGYR